MKIKRVECEQFAGVHDIDVEFVDGLNLVIGENESGKSTLADLIFRILFKDTKIDGRRDGEFIDWYFPKKVSGPQGDVIDGTLVFSTEKGTYKLTREWERRNGSSRLTTPEKTVIKSTDKIADILSEELGYREGVFDEIVFASQKRKQSAIESIMKALPKKKGEPLTETRENLTSTLTQAALETGGVSLEKIERNLQDKLDSYGSHWDFQADTPEDGRKRGINKKWKQGVGSILAAYYEMEETRETQKNTEEAEKKVEAYQKRIKEIQHTKTSLEGQLNEFRKYKVRLVTAASLGKDIERDGKDITTMEKILDDWPVEELNVANAEELQKQQALTKDKNRYLSVKKAQDEYEKRERIKNGLKEITRTNVKAIEDKINQKRRAESEISGLNLTARIKQLGELPIEVKSIATGEPVRSSDGEYNIAGAVEIMVPDIMEMQLIPKGVDVNRIREEISSANEEIQKGFEQFSVTSIKELQKKQEEYEEACGEYDKARHALQIILNGDSWEAIKEKFEAIDIELLSEEDLNKSIRALCGSKSIEVYLGGVAATLDSYQRTYGTKEDLSKRILETKTRQKENKEKLEKLNDIPEQYRQIKDPEKFEEDTRRKIEGSEKDIQGWRDKCNDELRGLGERTAEDYTEELLEKESAFSAQKAEYVHWKNISDLFFRMKEQIGGNPMEDIETKFREYLTIISDGNIKLQSIDEKMSANLSSGNNKLSYDILSNGTKDTISLAFRLAMLEHLYPEGGGLAVFDDTFTEMDPKRVQQSCKLIEKFAEKNQVIFITCDDKYSDLMKTDNIIKMSE